MIIPKGTVVTIDGKVYRTLEAQVAWNKEELESLDIDALEALPDQFTELQENVSALGDSVADVTEDVGELKSDMTDAQSDISGLKTRMTTAETNIGTNAGEISQLQFDVGQAQGDITALGTSKLNKPTNTGEVGDVIVKTANGTEYQAVAPFNPNGTYPNVTTGKAISAKSLENVSEDSGATQTAPFFFQATATANNTTETPTAPVFELKSIRGNTIVYNQLVDGMSTSYPTISGHTYWAFHVGQPPVIVVSQGTPISFPSPQSDKLVDLTRWFNGSIPQAILDDPTIFPINYYDDELTYSAGVLKDAMMLEFKTIGFNAWDEEWELGAYNRDTGAKDTGTDSIRSKNKFRVIPNTIYRFTCPAGGGWVGYYDSNENFIRGEFFSNTSNLHTDDNCAYCAFYMGSAYGTVYNHDVCPHLVWDGGRNGEYAPYVSHTYPLVWSGKSAGSAYDERLPDGTDITRIGSVDLESLNWTETTTSGGTHPLFFAELDGLKNVSSNDIVANIISSKYVASSYINIYYNTDFEAIGVASANGYLYVSSNSSPTGTLYYELTSPTTSEGTPYTSEIEGDDYGTMEFDSVVPVGNEFFYPADYALLIDDLGNYTGYDVTALAKKSDLIPAPLADGTYTLKAVKSGDTVTYTWEAVS